MSERPETVVLLSGLWLPGWCLSLLKRRLCACGFEVRVFEYRSVHAGLAENARALQGFLQTLQADTVHFVGYSLGGIVIRALFELYPKQRPGRIVTLATPHLGNRVATRLTRHRWGRCLLGQSVCDLVAGAPQSWVLPARDIGSLAGNIAFGLGMCCVHLPKPHDGSVTVAETRLPGSTDHAVLPAAHFSMLLSGAAARETCHFLRTGRFSGSY
jgi:pimeloyl-ACP methyl ester carboxylesterase